MQIDRQFKHLVIRVTRNLLPSDITACLNLYSQLSVNDNTLRASYLELFPAVDIHYWDICFKIADNLDVIEFRKCVEDMFSVTSEGCNMPVITVEIGWARQKARASWTSVKCTPILSKRYLAFAHTASCSCGQLER